MISLLMCFLPSMIKQPPSRTFLDIGTGPINSVWWQPAERPANDTPVEGFIIQQGDILVPLFENSRNAIKFKELLWKDGIIPYDFGDNFSSSEESLIKESMKDIEDNTCVRFVEKTDESHFIRFQKERKGCFAPIGRTPEIFGPMIVNLQTPECFENKGTIEHELLHVTGLFHEQARPDRDEYVDIHWCNIEPDKYFDFRKGSNMLLETYNTPYDYRSIMHYPMWAFSKNGLPTITSKTEPQKELGQRIAPTKYDFQKVIRMYDCDKKKRGKIDKEP